jgi:hypothetical protein
MPTDQSKEHIVFEEEQRFNQWWLWLLLLGLLGSAIYGMYQQLVLGEPFGSKPMSDNGIVVYFIFSVAMVVFFRWMRLYTHINKEGVSMIFAPFVTKKIAWDEIKNMGIVHYGFVGGWGIRPYTTYGTVYNISGAKGLAINLENGNKFLIGSQKNDELLQFIATHFPDKINNAL